MFFRRQRVKAATFAERLEDLRRAGYTVTPRGECVEASRGDCAVLLRETGGAPALSGRAGIRMGPETAVLVDGGFQKFFRAPSGKTRPALAADLSALHGFEEDLKEALGLESLYNESLGTVSTYYHYDRLQGR